MEIRYSEASIENLVQEIDADLSYSTLDIQKLSDSFIRVDADSQYGNLKIAVPEKTVFSLEADNMEYGNCRVSGLNITHSEKEDDYQRMEINGGGKRKIYYDGNSYGNIHIKRY